MDIELRAFFEDSLDAICHSYSFVSGIIIHKAHVMYSIFTLDMSQYSVEYCIS